MKLSLMVFLTRFQVACDLFYATKIKKKEKENKKRNNPAFTETNVQIFMRQINKLM